MEIGSKGGNNEEGGRNKGSEGRMERKEGWMDKGKEGKKE